MGDYAARLGLLSTVFVVMSLARGEVQSSGIMVSTNSEGETEVVVFKPNITETEIVTYIATMFPFSKPPNQRLHRALDKSFTYNMNPATDPIILLAPIAWNRDDSEEDEDDSYMAYVLPKGLSSLSYELKTQLIAAKKGMEKIALLLSPREVDAIGTMEAVPSSKLFPLDCIKVTEVKVEEGEAKTAKIDSIMDTLGYIRLGYKGTPWLILKDVTPQVLNDEEYINEGGSFGKIRGPGIPQFGKISLGADGNVAWNLFPIIPPVPIVPTPSFPISEYPIYPFYFPSPYLNPMPYWYLNPPPFFWPVTSPSKK